MLGKSSTLKEIRGVLAVLNLWKMRRKEWSKGMQSLYFCLRHGNVLARIPSIDFHNKFGGFFVSSVVVAKELLYLLVLT